MFTFKRKMAIFLTVCMVMTNVLTAWAEPVYEHTEGVGAQNNDCADDTASPSNAANETNDTFEPDNASIILGTLFAPLDGEYVAQVGDAFFTDLEDAIYAAAQEEGGGTVILLDDITLNESIESDVEGGEVTIDFNGKTIYVNSVFFIENVKGTLKLENARINASSYFIENVYGSVTLESSVSDDTVQIGKSFVKTVCSAEEGKGVCISGGTLNCSEAFVEKIPSGTNVYINGGKINVKTVCSDIEGNIRCDCAEGATICSTGTMFNVKKGGFVSVYGAELFVRAANIFEIDGGEVELENILITSCTKFIDAKNNSNIILSDGTEVTSDEECILAENCDIKIDIGATLTSRAGTCINAAGGTLNISGGTFKSVDSNTICMRINGADVIISNAQVNGISAAVEMNSGSLHIYDGTFKGKKCLDAIGGETVIENGLFDAAAYNDGCPIAAEGGRVTINAGTYKGAVAAVMNLSGELVINDGTFSSTYGYSYDACVVLQNTAKETVINGGSYTSTNGYALDADSGNAVISAGTFEGNIKAININSGTVEIAEDSAADPVQTEWESARKVTISQDAARIGDMVYTSLDSAFTNAAEGDTVVLLRDIMRKGKDPIVVDKAVLLDFNGCKLTVDRNTFDIQPTGSLTLINAQIIADSQSYAVTYNCFIESALKGEMIVRSTAGDGIQYAGYFINKLSKGASLIIESGTIDSEDCVVSETEQNSGIVVYKGTLINGQEFQDINGTIEISGGTFINKNGGCALPEDNDNLIIAEGYGPDPENWEEVQASVITIVHSFPAIFIGNYDGSAYSETITETYDEKYILPGTDPEREGYIFIGWFTDAADGMQITGDTAVSIPTYRTLYAHWKLPDPEPDPEPDPQPDPEPDPKPDPEPDPQPDPKPDPKPDPQPDPKPDPKPDPQPDPKPDPQPIDSGEGHSASRLFTGTWNSPVSIGSWTLDANGVWHYTTQSSFRSTWGYIVNPYASAGQHQADWFWFDDKGRMLTGWQFIGGKWYYLNPTRDGTLGACQLGGVTPDGWTVDENGAWIESIPQKKVN